VETVSADTHVTIIGAGPYGLSIAAHLKARAAEFRIFGTAMEMWRTRMPSGMRLKSEGFASGLYEPSGTLTLGAYCAETGAAYADLGVPVALSDFVAYGLAFQRRLVPELDERKVVQLERRGGAFVARLDDGEAFTSARVIVAVGLGNFAHVPTELASLPRELLSHSSDHHALDGFAGKDVAVIGAGSSALDIATLLHRAGARPQVIARGPGIFFHDRMRLPRTVWDAVRAPMSAMGPGWRSRFAEDLPLIFHVMPEWFRIEVVRRHLGPAPAWFAREETVGRVPFLVRSHIVAASAVKERLRLRLRQGDAPPRDLAFDHVIAATGFKTDVRRIPLLGENLLGALRTVESTPILDRNFQSSVPGLYFVGPASANAFGPLVRFACGARFTARRLAHHLAARHRRHSSRFSHAPAPV
jgi:hypothetical protein